MRIEKQDVSQGMIVIVPENSEDLWHIERLLCQGDYVYATTFRRFKTSEDDSGEKKKVKIKLLVEKIEFSKYSNKLRITGKIIEGTPEEFVQQGAYHTIDVEEGYPIAIFKDKWMQNHLLRIKEAINESKRPRIGILAIEQDKAIYATIRGYGIEYELELENNASKRDEKYEEKMKKFFEEIAKKLESSPVSKIIIAGPGFTKENFAKFLANKSPQTYKKIVLEECFSAERAGINELIKKGVISKITKDERIDKEQKLIDRFILELAKNTGLAAYGKEEVKKALENFAAEIILVEDELLKKDKEVEKIIIQAEEKKVPVMIFSFESDPGKQLAGYGGLAAILKYKMDY
jgi:protein pelota